MAAGALERCSLLIRHKVALVLGGGLFFWGVFSSSVAVKWPSIEFDFGLPHLQIERIRRKRLVTVVSLIVLPVVVNVIYDVMKSLRAAG